MKVFTVAAVLGLATPALSTVKYPILYDTMYDGTQTSLSSVVCSTGEYGLITYGYNTFGQIPSYPYLGGAPAVGSRNSPNCGTCWNLTYTDPRGGSTSVCFTAISTGAQGGFTISLAGIDTLTNGNSLTLDGVSVTAAQLPASACGM